TAPVGRSSGQVGAPVRTAGHKSGVLRNYVGVSPRPALRRRRRARVAYWTRGALRPPVIAEKKQEDGQPVVFPRSTTEPKPAGVGNRQIPCTMSPHQLLKMYSRYLLYCQCLGGSAIPRRSNDRAGSRRPSSRRG